MTNKKDSEERQVVSRERVAEHGEVYTAKREVNAMLDLVKEETERIDSRFLEPACGNGNFLIEIQRRKLDVVERLYGKSQYDYEWYAALAVSSMYGVELLPDNVEACRKRLYDDFMERYQRVFRKGCSAAYQRCIQFLYTKNILCGDALTMETAAGKPIVFSEWGFVGGGKVKRRDFRLDDLLKNVEYDKPKAGDEGLLFADTGEPTFVHDPIKEYPLTHYLNLPDHDQL